MAYSQQEIVEAGLDDFRVFMHEVWRHLELKPKGSKAPKATPVQNDIAKFLQHGDLRLLEVDGDIRPRERSRRRQIVMGYRGVGKSFITVAYVCWTLLLNPQAKIMVVSATEQLANDFSKFVQQLIDTMPMLQHLKPGRDSRTSVLAFDVGGATPDKSPSLKAVGITGQLTGSRADLIVADDIEIPKNSYSQIQREKLAILVREFDAVLKPTGKIVYLGTPQVEASLYNGLQKKGYTANIWPAEIPVSIEQYGSRLGAYIVKLLSKGPKPGTPTDPTRFDREDLDERLLSYGRSAYNLQFLLDTTLSDEDQFPLKLRDLLVADLDDKMAHIKYVWGTDPNKKWMDLDICSLDGDFIVRPAWMSEEMAPYTATIMVVDPSGRGKDETAYAIVKLLHGYLFVMEVGGFKDGFGEATLNAMAAASVRWACQKIIVEPNFGGGAFAQLLKPVVLRVALEAKLPTGASVEDAEWATGQKELRIIDTLGPVMRSHRLIVNRVVIEDDAKLCQEDYSQRYSLMYQMTRITREKGALAHDDRLECVAMACEYFTERLGRDSDKELKKFNEALEQAEHRAFLERARRSPTKTVIMSFSKEAPATKPKSSFGRRGRMG